MLTNEQAKAKDEALALKYGVTVDDVALVQMITIGVMLSLVDRRPGDHRDAVDKDTIRGI